MHVHQWICLFSLATRVLFSVQGNIQNNSVSFLVMGLIMSNEDCAAAAAAAALLRTPPLSSWVHGVCLVFLETTHLAFWDFEAPHKTAKCNLWGYIRRKLQGLFVSLQANMYEPNSCKSKFAQVILHYCLVRSDMPLKRRQLSISVMELMART